MTDATGVKIVFVGFSPTDPTAWATRVKMVGQPGSRPMQLVDEDLLLLANDNSADVPLGYGRAPASARFPRVWNAEVAIDGGACDAHNACNPTLEITPSGADPIRVPLGTFTNNAKGKGDLGNYEAVMRVVPVTGAALADAVLLVIDNREVRKPDVLARRGLLLGPAPTYALLWTGDLLGESCRVSVMASADGKPEVAYGCGRDAPTTIALP